MGIGFPFYHIPLWAKLDQNYGFFQVATKKPRPRPRPWLYHPALEAADFSTMLAKSVTLLRLIRAEGSSFGRHKSVNLGVFSKRTEVQGDGCPSTPLKINMELNHGGLVQIIFLSKWLICRFHVNFPGCRRKWMKSMVIGSIP